MAKDAEEEAKAKEAAARPDTPTAAPARVAETSAPAEGETSAPAEGESKAPAEGEGNAPAEGEASAAPKAEGDDETPAPSAETA